MQPGVFNPDRNAVRKGCSACAAKKKKEKAGSHWEGAQKIKANKTQIAQITQMNDAREVGQRPP